MQTTAPSAADRERGERLKSARVRAGLSLDKLGVIVGTSRQHLIRLEKGIHRPKPDMLARIAAAVNVDAEMIDPPQNGDGDDDEEASRVKRERALRLYDDLKALFADIVHNSNEPSGPLAGTTLGSQPNGG